MVGCRNSSCVWVSPPAGSLTCFFIFPRHPPIRWPSMVKAVGWQSADLCTGGLWHQRWGLWGEAAVLYGTVHEVQVCLRFAWDKRVSLVYGFTDLNVKVRFAAFLGKPTWLTLHVLIYYYYCYFNRPYNFDSHLLFMCNFVPDPPCAFSLPIVENRHKPPSHTKSNTKQKGFCRFPGQGK